MRLLAFFVVLPTLSLAASCSLFTSTDPVVDPPLVVSDGTPCGDACANAVNCERPADHLPKLAKCKDDCAAADADAAELISCLGQATCADLPACFPVTTSHLCAEVLLHGDDCGAGSVIGAGFSCQRLAEPHLNCLKTAACDALMPCFEGSVRADCVAMCTKLEQCNNAQGSAVECLEGCLADDDSTKRACVVQASCEQLDTCLVLPQVCQRSCARLLACDVIDFGDRPDCESDCLSPWPASFTDCVVISGCDELSGCGDLP